MRPVVRCVGGAALGSRAMALETSPQSPAPVRQIANAISQWVDRLGAGLGRGPDRPDQPPARARHRLHDAARRRRRHLGAGDLSRARSFDSLDPPLVEGASVVVHAKPSYYANRGTLSLARPRDPDGRPRRAAGPARAAPPAARRRGAVRARAEAAAAVPAPAASGWSPRPAVRRRARRARERPPPLAGGRLRGRRTPPCRARAPPPR